MVVAHPEPESRMKRIEKIVSLILEERPVFQEELNHTERVEKIFNLVQEHLTHEEFNKISDEELKENCSFVMSTEIISKTLEDLTPEQISIFDAMTQRT